jgi:hypothetical protein
MAARPELHPKGEQPRAHHSGSCATPIAAPHSPSPLPPNPQSVGSRVVVRGLRTRRLYLDPPRVIVRFISVTKNRAMRGAFECYLTKISAKMVRSLVVLRSNEFRAALVQCWRCPANARRDFLLPCLALY